MVLDTLRRFHIEEENSSGPMAQVIGRMEAIAADTGCAVVFLHHANKSASMMGNGDQQQASRGSSVLVDNIRWQSYLSGMTQAEAEEWGVDGVSVGTSSDLALAKQTTVRPFRSVGSGGTTAVSSSPPCLSDRNGHRLPR